MTTMTCQEYKKAYGEIKRQKKAAELALDIKNWGPCPGYRNHFDLKSFVIGGLLGVVVVSTGAAIIQTLGH